MSNDRQRSGEPVLFRAPGVVVSAMTDPGGAPAGNQDRFGCFPELSLFVVADGMGGRGKGDVAAGVAVNEIRRFFLETAGHPERPWPVPVDPTKSYAENRLHAAIRVANHRVFKENRPIDDDDDEEWRWQASGTTIVALFLTEDHVQIAHVGDSRAYLLRDGEIERLTRDHTLIGDYLRGRPDLTEEDVARKIKNVVIRTLGLAYDVKIDLRGLERREGDVYLLCSDGLHAQLKDEEIARIVHAHTALDDALADLLGTALRRDTKDNVTAILVRMTEH